MPLVPPVLHLGPNERLERTAARLFLDVPEGMTVVALQLGSGSNFDMRSVRNSVLKGLLDRPDTLVLDIRSPIRADFELDEPISPRHRIVELFPSFRYSRAFDAAVVAWLQHLPREHPWRGAHPVRAQRGRRNGPAAQPRAGPSLAALVC